MVWKCWILVGVIVAFPAGSVLAQSDEGVADESIEEIIVTGSRLPRRDFTATSPIATIDREALQSSGHATLEETLNKMPQVAPDISRSTNNGSDGIATVNLRALGAGRTLVLLNGRRVAPSGTGSAVDVNNLPQVLMERVEIITGGATTVYGADAVAGVVNFMTRADFDGFGIDVSAYVTELGDSNINDINVTYGHNFANGRGNLTVYGGYYDREETFGASRPFNSELLFDFWDGTIRPSGSSRIPEGIIQAPRHDFGSGVFDRITFDPDGNPLPYNPATDYYNYAPINYIQTPLQRTTAGAFLNYRAGEAVELYAEASYANNDSLQNLAPIPLNEALAINVDNPALTPEMQQIAANEWFPIAPGIVGAFMGRRLVELGPRILNKDFDNSRLVLGLRGEINEVWDFDAWYTFTKADEDDFRLNDASLARVQQGFLVDPVSGECFDPSGGCVPVNLFGAGNLSAEAVEFIRYQPFRNVTSREQTLVSAFIRGAPFSSWAGPINMAFGVEYRDDEGNFDADPALFLDDTLGYRAQASVNGSETVHEFYVEASVPLLEGASWAEYLGIEVGARFSDYQHAGGVETWKIGGEWQMQIPLRLRVMAQRSVRAPNLSEAFTEQGTEIGFYSGINGDNDPCTAGNDPVGNGIAAACVATGLPAGVVGTWEATAGFPTEFVFGGNPEVQPESADTLTAGFVFDLDWLQGMQVSVDYFDLDVEDTIGELDVTVACFDLANVDNLFCDNIQRDPLTYDVNRVFGPYINRGRSRVRGVDTQLNLETDLPAAMAIGGSGAGMSVNLIWTHTLEKSTQETPFGTVIDCNGTFGWPCNWDVLTTTYPENRVNTTLNYFSGDFSARLLWQWIDGTINGLTPHGETFGFFGLDLANPSLDDKSYLDLALSYRFRDRLAARLIVSNLTDSGPPLIAGTANGINTDTSVYDIYGRSYTLSLSMEF